MVGFSNITAQGMLAYIFLSYEIITAVDLDKNFHNIQKTWDTQQLVETLFKKIHDCEEFSELGGITIGESQKFTTVYTKILTTGILNSDCFRWDENLESDKTWDNFRIHFSTSYLQHSNMHGETAAASGYANADVAQPEEYIT